SRRAERRTWRVGGGPPQPPCSCPRQTDHRSKANAIGARESGLPTSVAAEPCENLFRVLVRWKYRIEGVFDPAGSDDQRQALIQPLTLDRERRETERLGHLERRVGQHRERQP